MPLRSVRVGCLFVPGFPLGALWRAEPDLRGQPVAVVDGSGPNGRIRAVSMEARALGIRSGLSTAQARSLDTRTLFRKVDDAQVAAAHDALVDVAASLSPDVEPGDAPGTVFLSLDGLTSLFESEEEMIYHLTGRCRRVGLGARVGIASSKVAALLAAKSSDGGERWGPAEEAARLAPLPVSLLDPEDDLRSVLSLWGIRSLGQLAALPRSMITSRLGLRGSRLWQQAKGRDEHPLRPLEHAPRFEEVVDLEDPLDCFEPLSFTLRAAFERVAARLRLHGLQAGDVEITLRLEDGGTERRRVALAAPTNDVRIVLILCRRHFESHPPRDRIRGFHLHAAAERRDPVELDLFSPPGPAPEVLDGAVARVAAMTGNDGLGRASPGLGWNPQAFDLESFLVKDALALPRERAEDDAPPCVPIALRAFRPPLPLDVRHQRHRPAFVRRADDANGRAAKPRGAPVEGRVVTLSGPWRLSGEWWCDAPLSRDYWDAELSDGGVYRIYREVENDRWYAEGVYD